MKEENGMKKVMVSKEVAEAFGGLKERLSDGRILTLLSSDMKDREVSCIYGSAVVRYRSIIRAKMSPMDTAQALLIGYVVDKTPEERILDAFLESPKHTYSCGCDNREFGRGEGIMLTLDTLGIRIKGVNA